MTAIYCGGDEYKIHFDNSSLVLSKTQIEELTDFVIANHSNFDGDISLKLDLVNDYLKEEVERLNGLLMDAEIEKEEL